MGSASTLKNDRLFAARGGRGFGRGVIDRLRTIPGPATTILAAKTSPLPPETINLIRDMAARGRLWGAERIRGELLKLGRPDRRGSRAVGQRRGRSAGLPQPRWPDLRGCHRRRALPRSVATLSQRRDRHHLIELCGLVGARVIDTDGVYDPSTPNDRLLLGLKGTMSEFELTVLRRHLLDAAVAKARRGKLRMPVPVGYVWHRDDGRSMDPDRRPPVYRNIISVLQNPFYAGAYAYGKSQVEAKIVDGAVQKRYGYARPREQWTVLLRDHHDGYIDWDQYEKNQERLASNSFCKRAGGAKSGRRVVACVIGSWRVSDVAAVATRRAQTSAGGSVQAAIDERQSPDVTRHPRLASTRRNLAEHQGLSHLTLGSSEAITALARGRSITPARPDPYVRTSKQ
jgi:hypothetical protein